MTHIIKNLFLVMFFSIALSGCIYKINIQQGNLISDESLSKLHAGMSVNDVEVLFSAPLVNDVYGNNRYVYVYTMKQGHHPMTRRQLMIYFINNKVVSYTVN